MFFDCHKWQKNLTVCQEASRTDQHNKYFKGKKKEKKSNIKEARQSVVGNMLGRVNITFFHALLFASTDKVTGNENHVEEQQHGTGCRNSDNDDLRRISSRH